MNKNIDYSLYLVTDRNLCKVSGLLEVICEAIEGGVSVIQLREKDITTSDFINLSREVKKLLRDKNIPLFINDRVDVAMAVGADGIHVGQEDMHVNDVRGLVKDSMSIGLSVNTLKNVQEAENLPVDYLGVGPVFLTQTKENAKPHLGLDGIKKIRQNTKHKLVAIGGIDSSNALEVIQTGVDGIAVVSAICASDSPRQSAEILYKNVMKARN